MCAALLRPWPSFSICVLFVKMIVFLCLCVSLCMCKNLCLQVVLGELWDCGLVATVTPRLFLYILLLLLLHHPSAVCIGLSSFLLLHHIRLRLFIAPKMGEKPKPNTFLVAQMRVWQLNRWPCHSLTDWLTDWLTEPILILTYKEQP